MQMTSHYHYNLQTRRFISGLFDKVVFDQNNIDLLDTKLKKSSMISNALNFKNDTKQSPTLRECLPSQKIVKGF